MNDGDLDFLDPSFLISRLVQCFCPDDLNMLSYSIDVLRSFNFNQCEFDTSVFRYRWISDLEVQGKPEEIAIMNRSIENIVKTVNRPNALFLLLDQLRPIRQPLKMDPERPFKSLSLPTDFLFVLQGLEGNNFKWNHQQHRFVSSDKLSPNLFTCALRISNIGCMVRTLLKFMEYTESFIHQFAACVVREIYVNHLKYISDIEASFPEMTPNQLLTYISGPPIDELQAAAIICTTVESMGAASIFNILDHISTHGDQTVVKVAQKMRDKSFEGIEKMIRSWVSKGEVDDPHCEFFIQVKGDVKIYSNWWHDRYFIAVAIVPRNLSKDMVQKIFSAGKALNFLRTCDQPIELEIDHNLPLSDFVEIAVKQANAHILGLIMKDGLFKATLHDIHEFQLLQRGDFTIGLIDADPKRVKLRVSNLMRELVGRDVDNITYDEGAQPSGALKFNAQSPLSAVLGPNEIAAYKVVSAILLRLKRTDYKLNHAVFKARYSQLLSFEMKAFLGLISDYLNIHIIHKSYEMLKIAIFQKEISFDDLLRLHTQHANFIARGCWSTNSGVKCRKILFQILDVIDILPDKFNNIKPDKKHTPIINDIAKRFHASIIKFQVVLLSHQVSGIDLAPPLARMFKNVFL